MHRSFVVNDISKVRVLFWLEFFFPFFLFITLLFFFFSLLCSLGRRTTLADKSRLQILNIWTFPGFPISHLLRNWFKKIILVLFPSLVLYCCVAFTLDLGLSKEVSWWVGLKILVKSWNVCLVLVVRSTNKDLILLMHGSNLGCKNLSFLRRFEEFVIVSAILV